MSRAIKFRCWDGSSWQTGFSINSDGEITSSWGADKSDWIVQQWTGLTDKNGRDIYEGDIVRSVEAHEAYLMNKFFGGEENLAVYSCGHIKWFNEAFFVCQSEIGATYLHKFSTCDCPGCYPALEVIGNVFENPELLNNENN